MPLEGQCTEGAKILFKALVTNTQMSFKFVTKQQVKRQLYDFSQQTRVVRRVNLLVVATSNP